ncbi:hypothetical protein NDU88_012628 [Pleurodeles waltl]|uniref:Uncharacterized protein n=1 Tax=Pleurodeles waltl TaxID=8319 RepID=A0AAV7R508_PLEWA|nr:hypothetical protein NDU88_012628 [Pleurodeles waltl]
MGRNKSDRPNLSRLGSRRLEAQRDTGAPPDPSETAILAAHAQKFDDILNAVQSIKSTLEPKVDALHIGVGYLREEHKKPKDRVTTTESTVSELCPSLANATTHIKDLQKEVLHLRQRLVDQEGRSCLNNIHVVGLPEQEGGPGMDLYMEQEGLRGHIDSYYELNENTASDTGIEWGAFKMVLRGHAIKMNYGTALLLHRELWDLESELQHYERLLPTDPGQLGHWRIYGSLIDRH